MRKFNFTLFWLMAIAAILLHVSCQYKQQAYIPLVDTEAIPVYQSLSDSATIDSYFETLGKAHEVLSRVTKDNKEALDAQTKQLKSLKDSTKQVLEKLQEGAVIHTEDIEKLENLVSALESEMTILQKNMETLRRSISILHQLDLENRLKKLEEIYQIYRNDLQLMNEQNSKMKSEFVVLKAEVERLDSLLRSLLIEISLAVIVFIIGAVIKFFFRK